MKESEIAFVAMESWLNEMLPKKWQKIKIAQKGNGNES